MNQRQKSIWSEMEIKKNAVFNTHVPLGIENWYVLYSKTKKMRQSINFFTTVELLTLSIYFQRHSPNIAWLLGSQGNSSENFEKRISIGFALLSQKVVNGLLNCNGYPWISINIALALIIILIPAIASHQMFLCIS